jgi:hypothetical protein
MTAPDQCCTNLKKLMLKIPQCGASFGRSVLLGILGAIPNSEQFRSAPRTGAYDPC